MGGPISYREWLRKHYDTLREEKKYAEDNSRGRGRHTFRTAALPCSMGDLESLRTETSTAVDEEVVTLEVETPSRIDRANGMEEAVDGATEVPYRTQKQQPTIPLSPGEVIEDPDGIMCLSSLVRVSLNRTEATRSRLVVART